MGWICDLVIEHLLNTCEVLVSIPLTKKNLKRKKETYNSTYAVFQLKQNTLKTLSFVRLNRILMPSWPQNSENNL